MKLNTLTMIFCILTLQAFGSTKAEMHINPSNTFDSPISDWEARLNYARLLSYMKKYDESIVEYHKLLEAQPDSVTVRIELAKIFYYQQKYLLALETLDQIPKEQSNEAVQLLNADIFLALKEYSKAEKILRNQLKQHPEDISSKLKLAELLSWQKKYSEAVNLYQQILSLRPNDIQVRRKYATVLMWMGNFEESATEMKKALPND